MKQPTKSHNIGGDFDMLLPDDRFLQDDEIEIMSIQQTDIELHSHTFLEMVYITGGKSIHTLDETEVVVKKGDFFIINYDTGHKYTLIDQEEFHLINVLFKPQLIDKALQNCRSFQELIHHYLIRIPYAALKNNPTRVIYHDMDGSIFQILDKMQREYDKKETGYIELLRCYLIEVIIRTMRTISKEERSSLPQGSSFLKEYIDQNYMKQISLSQVSKELNFSLSYLCRKFKKDTGVTFVSYLQQRRMEQSGRLIANTDKTISEIAELVGYQDIKFFYKVFKKHWAMTPAEFRKAYRT